MKYLALLALLGLRCVGAAREVALASCLESTDIRYKLQAGESRDLKFGADQAEMDNALVAGPQSSEKTNDTDAGEGNRQGHCGARIHACYDCHLRLTFLNMRLPSCASGKTCRCNYVSIVEVDYEKTRKNLCGIHENASHVFETKTRGIKLDFVFDDPYNSDFTIRVQAMYNIYIIQGHSNNYRGNRSGHIESPHFPQGYPSYYSSEYQLRNLDPDGYVQLIYTDFLLSPWSYVKVEDTNGSEIHRFRGNTFRPPVLTSSGPNMTIKFRAEDELPSPGFRAKYTFLKAQEKYLMKVPDTDCGGYLDDYGGKLTMNLVSPDPLQGYDCVWIIKPKVTDETHLSLRVVQFQDMGPKSQLSIYQGVTSKSELLETLVAFDRYETNSSPHSQEFMVSVDIGYYISFSGYFTNRSRMVIIYTAFKFESCINGKDFRCNNGRCIKPVLHCDGINHCDDNSDEVPCYDDSTWWRTLTPNYYFTKTDGGAGGGTNTLILITSMAGLGMFVLTTALILVKLHKQRREDTTRHMLRTVSGDVDSSPRLSPNSSGEPPLYDPPPSYEDVIKFYLPPPPTYTSLSDHMSSPSSAGLDNSGFVPDASPESPTRHFRSASALPHALLNVILPTRVLSRNASAPGPLKDQGQSTEAFSLDLSVTEGHRSTTADFRERLPKREEFLMDLTSPTDNQEPPPPYEIRPSVEEQSSKCTCQGACCCPARQELTVTSESPQLSHDLTFQSSAH